MAILTPYSSSDIKGVGESGFSASDYPRLQFCLPMTEADLATKITEIVTGTTFDISNATAIKRAEGGLGFGTAPPTFTQTGTLNDLGGKDLLLLCLGTPNEVAQSINNTLIGTDSGTEPSLQIGTGASWYTEDFTNLYKGDSTPTLLADATDGAWGVKVGYNATIASATVESFAEVGSTEVITSSAGAESAGTTFTGSLIPSGMKLGRSTDINPNFYYGIMVFTFDSMPADWQAAVQWMYQDWKPIDANTPGRKRIYPGWMGKS